MTNKAVSLSGLSAVLLLVGAETTAQAQTATYTGTTTGLTTGNTLSAQAIFSISKNVLTIQLTNTGGPLSNRADTLTTVLFSFNNVSGTVFVPADTTDLATTPATTLLTNSSIVYGNNGNAYAVPLGTEHLQGAYVFDAQPNSKTYNYGVGTSAFNSTGTGDKYSFSGMTGGKAAGNDDFSVAGFGTPSLNQAIPVVQSGIQVVVSGFSNLTSTSQIKNVGFGFASGAVLVNGTPTYQIAPGTFQPTPATPGGTAAVLGAAMAMIGRIRSIRRLRRNAATQTAG